MRLGFAVKVLGRGGLPSHDTRRWQSGPHLRTSLEYLRAVLLYLDDHDIRMYRMATALAPYASHPDLPQFHGQVEECAAELADVGELARRLDVRLSTHPGQYTVLNSEALAVRRAAAAELEVLAALLDTMGLPGEAVVVVHAGGAVGGNAAASDRFLAGFETLSERARARLVLENDDRSFASPPSSSSPGARACPWSSTPTTTSATTRTACPIERRSNAPARLGRAASPRRSTTPRRASTSASAAGGVGRRVERTPALPDLRLHADLIDPIAFELFLRSTGSGLDFDVMSRPRARTSRCCACAISSRGAGSTPRGRPRRRGRRASLRRHPSPPPRGTPRSA